MPASSKYLLDIQANIECGLTLKRVRDMIRRYSIIIIPTKHVLEVARRFIDWRKVCSSISSKFCLRQHFLNTSWYQKMKLE